MLSENIAALRKARGMSQQALAEQLFVTRQTISKWEKGLSVPDAEALIRLADALDTTVQSLLGQTETSAVPSDVAAALSRINDQLAIQNRRRARLWKALAGAVALLAVVNLLVLALAYAGQADLAEGSAVTTTEEVLLIEE